MKIVRKVLAIALMIAAPIITWKAFYEYISVKYLDHKPSYPFGKDLMKSMQFHEIHYLSGYENELLTIGLVFLGISIIAYISTIIKALINLVWLAVIATIGFFIYTYAR